MALRILGFSRQNGPGCDHLDIRVEHEGTVRRIHATYAELDALVPDGEFAEAKSLVAHFIKYRRRHGRPWADVDIA